MNISNTVIYASCLEACWYIDFLLFKIFILNILAGTVLEYFARQFGLTRKQVRTRIVNTRRLRGEKQKMMSAKLNMSGS